jgi:hypothetical protein
MIGDKKKESLKMVKTKTKTRVVKRVFSFFMAVALCMTMSLAAFAAPEPSEPATSEPTTTWDPKVPQGTGSANQAKAAITKALKMPIGTDTPEVTFTFDMKLKQIDDITDSTKFGMTQTEYTKTVEFDGKETWNKIEAEKTGIKMVYKETGDLNDSIFDGITWPRVGVYYFDVTEQQQVNKTLDPDTEKMTFSKAEYQIKAYIKLDEATNKLYVWAIVAEKIKNDDETDAGKDKVDPTPGGGDKFDYSQMIFTNEYLKENGGTDPKDKDDVVLYISKEVKGMDIEWNKYFEFNVTVSNPATFPVGGQTDVRIGYIMQWKADKSGFVALTAADLADYPAADKGIIKYDNDGAAYIEFTAGVPLGEPVKVHLKHNQVIGFIKVPVGSPFAVTETGNADYIPSYVIKIGADTNLITSPSNVAAGDSLGFPRDGESIYKYHVGEKYTGGNGSYAEYTNTRKDVTPTGVNTNDMPYNALIAVVLVALGGFIVLTARRRSMKAE